MAGRKPTNNIAPSRGAWEGRSAHTAREFRRFRAPAVGATASESGGRIASAARSNPAAPRHRPVPPCPPATRPADRYPQIDAAPWGDRKSAVSGKRVSVRVDPGGCRTNKKKKDQKNQ